MLMAAMIPFIANMANNSTTPNASSIAMPIAATNTTPPMRAVAPLPPLPLPGTELNACLRDFHELKGVDLTSSEAPLLALELTPDIIPGVPVSRLCEITDVIEGKMWRFQAFCRDWTTRLEENRQKE